MSKLGSDIQIAPESIYQTSTTQQCDLGARATTGDGRYFRYTLGSGVALVAGKVYQSPPQDTTNWQKLGVSAAAAIGTFKVSTGSSVTLNANQLAGGTLIVRDGTGVGLTYGIASNPAVSSGTVTITLSDPIQVALDTTSIFDMVPNPYSQVILAPTALTASPVGVAVVAAPASTYCWLQTRGPCNVLSDGAITVGRPVAISTTASGALQAASSGTHTVVGVAGETTTDAKYGSFFLKFE